MRSVTRVLLAAIAILSSGCTGGGSPAGGAAVPGIDPASRLDLDGGRVTTFSPRGWRRAPRSSDSLVRYQAAPQVAYPSVVVVAADPPEGFVEVTPENHVAFVTAITARIVEGDGTSVLRTPERALVGPHRAATWSAVGEAKLDGRPRKIARECTAVVVAGRLYTVEAWEPRDKVGGPAREAARAVAASLSLPTPNESPDPEAEAGPPQSHAEPPAATD